MWPLYLTDNTFVDRTRDIVYRGGFVIVEYSRISVYADGCHTTPSVVPGIFPASRIGAGGRRTDRKEREDRTTVNYARTHVTERSRLAVAVSVSTPSGARHIPLPVYMYFSTTTTTTTMIVVVPTTRTKRKGKGKETTK